MMKLVAFLLAISVSGCVNGYVTKSCDWAKPIRPTNKDVDVISDKLTRQVLEHNVTGSRVCGWKP